MRIINLVFVILLSGIFQSQAKTITVSSVPELKNAISNASEGEEILIANGIYTNADVNIKANGIMVKAVTPGGALFNGSSSFKITGDKNTLSGVQFKDGDIGANGKVVEISGNFNVLTQCNFYNYVSKNYIHVEGGAHDNEISYCNIEAKPATMNGGPGIQVTTDEKVVSHTRIRFCTFLNFGGDGGDFGNEPIRIGLGVEQNNTSGTLVEFCYFENLGLGDSETISMKSTYNTIRYNTFYNNPLAQVVFRTGNKNAAYSNFFINSGGIRIKEGHNHMVYNNYFQGAAQSAALDLMNFKLNKKTLVGSALDSIFIYHNTFYNPGKIMLGGEGDNPPSHVVFANNIFFKEANAIFENLNPGVSFLNNIYFGGAQLGMLTKEVEFANKDPKLEINISGYYSIAANSPAIGAANSNYPAIINNPVLDNDHNLMLDIAKLERPAIKSKKAIGCNEYSMAKVGNHPLKKSEVGPSYLANVVGAVPALPKITANNNIPDTSTFENEYFKVSKNKMASDADELGTKVIVALSNIKIKAAGDVFKIARGEVKVFKNKEEIKINKGEFFEVVVKDKHPKIKVPGKWIEPEKNTVIYEDKSFRIFEENLAPGDTRALHSHAQRMVIRLNEVQLTDPRYKDNKLPGSGVQVPNTAKFADAAEHVVKNLSTSTALHNIVIEFKLVN